MDENELAKKYGLDIEALKKEQIKLAKNILIKDKVDFSLATRFGAVSSLTIQNQIISAVIIVDSEFNIIDQQYFLDKLRFPYMHEFRSYRELPSMVEAFNKLSEKPDVVFVSGHGISHPRLGLASHFSLLVDIPTIGVSGELFDCDSLAGEDIIKDKQKVGMKLQSKENSNPIFISPGNNISIKTSFGIAQKFVKHPHKLPEPLHMVGKYLKEVREELGL